MSLGTDRVRLSFNPGAKPEVEEIKAKTAELIDLVEAFKASATSEINRLASLAQTHYEDAAMWAVKAATA